MPARSSSPAGPRQALKRKRQPLRPGAASALQVVGVLFALLFFAVLLDEVAQCVDYAWEAVTVNFVLLAYTVTAYFVVEHARENGSDKTLERLLAVLDWVKEEGPRILLKLELKFKLKLSLSLSVSLSLSLNLSLGVGLSLSLSLSLG